MSRRVPNDRLEIIHRSLSARVRKRGKLWIDLEGSPVMEAHDLICLFDEIRQRRKFGRRTRNTFKRHAITVRLTRMIVGDSFVIEKVSQHRMTTYRSSARKILMNPDAVWRTTSLDGGMMKVERVPNGSSPHRDYSNPAAEILSRLNVGDKAILTTLKGKMHDQLKIKARQLAGDLTMNWRCENLANGNVRATRIA